MSEEDGAERRQEVRLNKVLGAVLGAGEEAQRVRIFVINLSQGGLKATHQQPLPLGSHSMQLYLSSKSEPLELQAEVAWQRELPLSGMFEVGFRFVEMSPEDRQRLEDYIQAELAPTETRAPGLSLPWKFSPG